MDSWPYIPVDNSVDAPPTQVGPFDTAARSFGGVRLPTGNAFVMDAVARLTCSASRFELSEVRGEEDWREVSRIGARASPGLFEAQFRERAFDSATFLVRRNGLPVATACASLSGPDYHRLLLADTVFRADVARQLGHRPRYVEMGLPAVVSLPHAHARFAHLCLLKAAMMFGLVNEAAWLFTAVHEDEIGFHGRMLGMEILSGPEEVPVMSRHHVLMGFDLRNVPSLERRLPLFAMTPEVVEDFRQTGQIPALFEAVGSPAI